MPIKTITITGAAGQIGYQLAFRIASGQLLGLNEKINLKLLEIPTKSQIKTIISHKTVLQAAAKIP